MPDFMCEHSAQPKKFQLCFSDVPNSQSLCQAPPFLRHKWNVLSVCDIGCSLFDWKMIFSIGLLHLLKNDPRSNLHEKFSAHFCVQTTRLLCINSTKSCFLLQISFHSRNPAPLFLQTFLGSSTCELQFCPAFAKSRTLQKWTVPPKLKTSKNDFSELMSAGIACCQKLVE